MEPISAQQALAVQARDAGASSGQNPGVSTEHKLAQYIAQMQVQGFQGQGITNPAALGSEALMLLKGYLERAGQMQESQGARVKSMEENTAPTPDGNEGLQNAVFTPGPAERYFEPAAPVQDGMAEAVAPAMSNGELDRAIHLLSEMLRFGFETSFIGVATNNVSKAANTLLHGQ